MKDDFFNCWQIKKCGREMCGVNELESGECPTSKMGMGHSCWAVAGSFNGGEPCCPSVISDNSKCSECEVFRLYRRTGLQSKGSHILAYFPEEEKKYIKLMAEMTLGKT